MLQRALRTRSAASARAAVGDRRRRAGALARAADGDARRALNLLEVALDLARAGGGVDHRADRGGGLGGRLPPLRQGGRAVLRPDLRAAQVGARLRPGRGALLALPHARRRLRSALRRAARAAHGVRGHRQRRPARAGAGAGGLARPTSGSAAPRASSRSPRRSCSWPCAAKSNAVYVAFGAAMADAESTGTLEVPLRLRNAPTGLMKELGYGKGYRYAHDEPDAFAAGEQLLSRRNGRPRATTRPCDRGLEIRIARGARPSRANPLPRQGSQDEVSDRDSPLSCTLSRQRIRPCSTPSCSAPTPKPSRAISRAVASRWTSRAFRALEERRKSAQVAADELRAARNAMPRRSAWRKGKGEDIAALLAEGEALARAGSRPRGASRRGAGRVRRDLRSACRTCCTTACRTGATRRPTSRCAAGARRASSISRRSTTSTSARSSRWSTSRRRGSIAGARFVVLQGRRRAPAPRADPVHARPAHAASTATPRSTCRTSSHRDSADRHRPAAEVRSGPVRVVAGEQELLPDPDRRGAGDEPRARADPRGRTRCRAGTSRTRRASAPRPAPTARTRAA